MVALKPLSTPPNRRKARSKQERRGGIETAPPRSGGARPRLKQERRGGIETRSWLESAVARIRSRNAVVALKRASPGWIASPRDGSRNAVVALKPHGAGGGQEADLREAGTPWWH